MKRYIYFALLIFSVGLLLPTDISAQKKDGNRKKAKTTQKVVKVKKESPIVKVKARLVDNEGKAISNAAVISGEGADVVYTDVTGAFSLNVRKDGILIIEALGFRSMYINLSTNRLPKVIKMTRTDLYAGENDWVARPDGGKTSRRDLTGAGGQIKGDNLATYPDLMLSNALQGRAGGLVVTANVSGLANNNSNLHIRGQHGQSNNTAVVVIDGAERAINDLMAEEIESIELLKDPITKILYGPRAANGVLWITTKRGHENRRTIKVSAEAGITRTTRLPKYINSYQYVNLYNEARRNDGYPDFYSKADLEGYKNSSGIDDILYPDVDYYKEFLKDQTFFRKMSVDVNGGNKNALYSLFIGYYGNGGFEKVGDNPDYNALNFRGNIDVKVNDYLSVRGGIAAQLGLRNWSSVACADVFSAISTHRPNLYPLIIPDPENTIGVLPDSTGIPTFGANRNQAANLYADMKYGGYSTERNLRSQANLQLDFNLDKLLKGLQASVMLTVDNYNYFMNGQRNTYPTYAIEDFIDLNGELKYKVTQMRKLLLQSNQSRLGEETRRNNSWMANAAYHTQIGLHELETHVAHRYLKQEVQGANQDVINSNTTLRLNYGYDKKYALELDFAYMGSNAFSDKHKFFFSPALGGSWILSEEDFLKGITNINFLKLRASYGILGYDIATPALTYQTAWYDGGTPRLGEQNVTKSSHITSFRRIGNPDLKWERSYEWNVGVQGLFFQNRLSIDFNYFNELHTDIAALNTAEELNVVGSFTGYHNIGKMSNHGIETDVSWKDNVGDLNYRFGLNLTWSKTKLLEWNQVNYPDESIKITGKPFDVMIGYDALGLFGRDVSITNHPAQMLGAYQEGDIAYADLNNDNIVDENDRKVLGNSFPRTNIGIEVDLRYKGFGLYVQGVSQLGIDKWLTNSYYWMSGEDKYSVLALNRYHPTENPLGTYPRLTTTSGTNNFRNSSYWIANANFFRLKNVELSYTFPNKLKAPVFRNLKLFVRGNNLWVFSKLKDVDPEIVNAGVQNYPVTRTITGGISVNF